MIYMCVQFLKPALKPVSAPERWTAVLLRVTQYYTIEQTLQRLLRVSDGRSRQHSLAGVYVMSFAE